MFGRQDILDAMGGIALVLDHDLCVVAGGWQNWSSFWRDNGGAGPAPRILGCDLTEGFTPAPLRAGFRAALMALAAGERGPLRMPFRCDAPGLRRDMLLSVTRCGDAHLLYHATLLAETAHPVRPDAPAFRRGCVVCARPAPDAGHARLDWAEPAAAVARWPVQDLCPRCALTLAAQAA
jgi:hypothetical protein